VKSRYRYPGPVEASRSYSGNALQDGYSCFGKRPRGAGPGVGFLPEEEAESYEDMSDLMMEFGGRESLLMRRMRSDEE
jgi:hypothetical protein